MYQSATVLATSVDGYLSNILLKFQWNRHRDVGGVGVLRFFYF